VSWNIDQIFVWTVRCAFVVVLLTVCITDWRQRRIPNAWVLAGLVIALLWHALATSGAGLFAAHQPGAQGLFASAGGALAGFAVFLLLHLARMMGAGDVKLMAMVGAFVGPAALPVLILTILATGGLLVLIRAIDRQRRTALVANLKLIVAGAAARSIGVAGPSFDPKTDTADRLPYAFAISGGAVAYALMSMFAALPPWAA